GKIAPGDLVAYVLYVSILLNSITRIMEFTEQFQKGITGIYRFMEIMDIPIMIKDSKDSVVLDKIKGKVEFKDVKFKYVGSNDGVLNGINMVIEPHENVALVGPSGAGKTTICNLIERFYDANDGQVLIDGVDIKKIRLKCLHKIVGSVHQDIYLFSGSIYENICYGNLKANYEQVIDAAKKAGIHDFIESLPDKYNTYVGERGVKLSGGQKQRISIARVFLKDPPILILDEATSSLDSESEKIIQESLKKLSKGRTTIAIAHRLTSIKKSDRIYVLRKGEIEEKGTHEQLMKNGGLYSSLYNTYIN
ncbi:MAG: ATP-binding cassette domain-containing protein, partial [Oscillospiraceae bacterium]|nr:ATP-binding cassette domain-containing protein [Oscillospiraceae bacterium]